MIELTALRDAYGRDKAALLATLPTSLAHSRSIHTRLRKLSQLTSTLLCALWQRADLPHSAALVSVGGFGRHQLFPYSDVDVLLLLPAHAQTDTDPALRQRIEAFIHSCWDVGLEIGSSVRNVAECLAQAAQDVTVQTSLLEARRVCGNAELFTDFQQQFQAHLDPQAFLVGKTLEMHQRHNKYDNTPYALEPNCKESPGALRDLQMIVWVARAAGLGDSWSALADSGLATPFEVRQIERNEAVLCMIRTRLHMQAGRREDRLVFDLQTPVAQALGYTTHAPDGSRLPIRASEALLLGRQGSPAAVPDPAAQYQRAPEPAQRRTATHQRAFF